MNKAEKKLYVVWSGEGEQGHKRLVRATERGIKSVLTRERCGGDRWSYAATYTGDKYLDCCSEVRTRSINY